MAANGGMMRLKMKLRFRFHFVITDLHCADTPQRPHAHVFPAHIVWHVLLSILHLAFQQMRARAASGLNELKDLTVL